MIASSPISCNGRYTSPPADMFMKISPFFHSPTLRFNFFHHLRSFSADISSGVAWRICLNVHQQLFTPPSRAIPSETLVIFEIFPTLANSSFRSEEHTSELQSRG